MEAAVAAYGAGLATLIALGQLFNWWKKRIFIDVEMELIAITLQGDPSESIGTPFRITNEWQDLNKEILISIRVINKGGTAVQITEILIEGPESTYYSAYQAMPDPLPFIINPGTRIEIQMQKEPLDMLTSIVFFGIVDATGKRYTADKKTVKNLVEESWNSPTRVMVAQRRDNPDIKVVAFQSHHALALRKTQGMRGYKKIITSRNKPEDWP